MKKWLTAGVFFFLLPLLWTQETGAFIATVVVQPSVEVAEAAFEDDSKYPELDIEFLLRKRITEIAQGYLGIPYKYAGVTPEGFDCTGFIAFVYYEAAGMTVSRSSVGIWNSGKKIPLTQVRPGDVLVFTTVRAGASHAGIVLENGPRGVIFIHSASQGSETGVIISNMNEKYYKSRFMGARNYF